MLNLERADDSRLVAMKLMADKTESVYRRYAIVSELGGFGRNARAGIRTRTGLPPRDFKSHASTSFATRAGKRPEIYRSLARQRLPPHPRSRACAPRHRIAPEPLVGIERN